MKDIVADLQNQDLYGVLEYVAHEYGMQPAFTDCIENNHECTNHSYQELLADVKRLAAGIQILVGNDVHIVLSADNSYNWIVCFFAIICSGNIVIPLDVNMSEMEVSQALMGVDAQVFVSDRPYSGNGVQHYSLMDFIAIGNEEHSPFHYQNKLESPSIFLMTSGVVSAPKYVMLSQRNLIYSTLNGVDAAPIASGKVVLSILPFHHSYELSGGLLYHICCGSHIYINGKKEDFLKNFRTIAPQCLVAVPSVVYSLLSLLKAEKAMYGSSCVQKLEIIYCGGASINSQAVEEFYQNKILVLQGYGMTECSPVITLNRLDDFTTDTVGKPPRFVQIQMKDGEIYVKAPNVMIGYYKNPVATAEALQNGWFKTGDIGRFDNAGHLILCGRVKNVIVLKNGENIYPEELEETIHRMAPDLSYCKVYEEQGCVAAELYAPGYTEDDAVELIKKMNSTISPFKRIERVHLLSYMPPVTALGKPYRQD